MELSDKITLTKNSRGVYDLDTTKGCFCGTKQNPRGCYGDCYAAGYFKKYGYNFTKKRDRKFVNVKHLELIRDKLMNIDMPFVRIGVSGDPSENWSHTVSVVKLIYGFNKSAVITTKHWKEITDHQLSELSKFNVCFNTSVSALDSPKVLKYRLKQFNRIKQYCKSILRVVSCDFNSKNLTGLTLNEVQKTLFKNDLVIDNVLRVSKSNPLIKQELINIEKVNFLGGKSLMSIKNKNTFIGYCNDCPEMCGVNL